MPDEDEVLMPAAAPEPGALSESGPATYRAHVKCRNCTLDGRWIDIPKGSPVSTAPCPNCGVRALDLFSW